MGDVKMAKIKVGDEAPDFSLPSCTDEKVKLAQFLGKKNVAIFFYPMDESPVCSREAKAFRDKYEAFKEQDAVVIGISSQGVESHKAFARHHRLPFILLSDADNAVRKLYAAPTTLGVVPGRVTFVIDKKGVVKYVFSSQFQPAKHADEALRALKRENESKQ
jgi:peroxiredoxin Q/BCP